MPLPVPDQFQYVSRQVEVREDTVHLRRYDLARRADVDFVELVITCDAEQRQTDAIRASRISNSRGHLVPQPRRGRV